MLRGGWETAEKVQVRKTSSKFNLTTAITYYRNVTLYIIARWRINCAIYVPRHYQASTLQICCPTAPLFLHQIQLIRHRDASRWEDDRLTRSTKYVGNMRERQATKRDHLWHIEPKTRYFCFSEIAPLHRAQQRMKISNHRPFRNCWKKSET